jgi:predicted site-specific integrase-resolvase
MKSKAIIYTRVSTDDQKENGFSLQDQEARLRKYCQQNDIEILDHYQDDHSAKNFNRPAFTVNKVGLLVFNVCRPVFFLSLDILSIYRFPDLLGIKGNISYASG